MLREKLYQRLGVRDEHSTNFLAATALVVISNIYAKRTGLEVAGCPVSSDGGEIIIFQHLDISEPIAVFLNSENIKTIDNTFFILVK